MRRFALLALVIASVLALPQAGVGHSGVVFRAFGTPAIDAVQSTGEWDAASRHDFTVNRSPNEGGGTVTGTVYVMNDAANLYVALRVPNTTVGSSRFEVTLDNDHDQRNGLGDDRVALDDVGFEDHFYQQIAPNTFQWTWDDDAGGTIDGHGLDADHAGFSFYELRHPLNSADDAHDVSLRAGSRVGVDVLFVHCVAGCGGVNRVTSADFVVVSGTRVPPDTQLTSGPGEGSITRNPETTFAFTGTDDVIPANELTFECALDDAAWSACSSGHQFGAEDGRHTFRVRALDEGLIPDASPAERRWTVDTTFPSRPRVRGPRRTRSRRPTFHFSSSDALTPRGRIRFRCSANSRRLRSCPSRYRPRLRRGRNTLRVEAIDQAGNVSARTTVRVVVRR